MNICLRMSSSQIHKKIKLDVKIKINMQLCFESLVQRILTHILMITRPGKGYKVIENIQVNNSNLYPTEYHSFIIYFIILSKIYTFEKKLAELSALVKK